MSLYCVQHCDSVLAVYLSLGPTNITTNNTEVLITDIGEDDSRSPLTCHTDLTTCCRRNDTGGLGELGAWYYPDGSAVLNVTDSQAAGEDFFFVRDAPRLIRLSRRSSSSLTPTGSYCCVIPTTGGEMTICANIGECVVVMTHLLAIPAVMYLSK